ncbi:MAG: RpiB/LacA/LacB family sugar-phosphate isomerase [Lawsonibacter sp.]|jgi:ribose 5-phosphate isomerase B
MKLLIASDKSGFSLKEAVKDSLIKSGHTVLDIGTQDTESPVPYYECAQRMAQKIQSGEAERGILCCGTGMGMSIVANKYKGIYASCCESVYAAKMCRAVNDANVLCMGGWLIADWLGIRMAETFLSTEFTQDLEEWRKEWLSAAKTHVQAIEEQTFSASHNQNS